MTPAEVLTTPLLAAFPREDTRIIHEPGLVHLSTPSVPIPSRNEVYVADGDHDALLERWMASPAPFKWTVVPGSRPQDMGERLRALGLRGWWAAAMRAPSALEGAPARVVSTYAELDAWEEAFAGGWDWPDVYRDRLHRDLRWAYAEGRMTFVSAQQEGRVVGTAAIAWGPRFAYLTGGQVLPSARRAGLYRSLIHTRLELAAERGLEVLTLARGSSSAPILARWGFETLFEYELFQRDAQIAG